MLNSPTAERRYRPGAHVMGTRLGVIAVSLLALGLVIGVGVFAWFDHRHIVSGSGATMMRITTLGEPRLGARVGGLIFLGFLFVASMVAWFGHVLHRR